MKNTGIEDGQKGNYPSASMVGKKTDETGQKNNIPGAIDPDEASKENDQETLATLPPKDLRRELRLEENSGNKSSLAKQITAKTAGKKGKQLNKPSIEGGLNMVEEQTVPRATTIGKQTGENPKPPNNQDEDRETGQERMQGDLSPEAILLKMTSPINLELPKEGLIEEGGLNTSEGQENTEESVKSVKLDVKSDSKKTIELNNAIDALFSQVEKMSPVNVVDLGLKIARETKRKIKSVNLKNLSNDPDTLKEIRASAKKLVKESFSDLISKYYVLNERTIRYNEAQTEGDEALRDAKEEMNNAAGDVQAALHAVAPLPLPPAAAAAAAAAEPFTSIMPNGNTKKEEENFIKFVLISVLAQIYADFPVDTHLIPETYTKKEQGTVSKFIAGSNWNPVDTAILRSNLICNGATINALQDDFLKIQRSDGVSDQSKNEDALIKKLTLLTDYLVKSDYAITQEVSRARGEMPWGQLILSNFRGKEQHKPVVFKSIIQTTASAFVGLGTQKLTMLLTPMNMMGFCEEDRFNMIPTAKNSNASEGLDPNGSNGSIASKGLDPNGSNGSNGSFNGSSSSNGSFNGSSSSNGSSSLNGSDGSIALNNESFTMMRNNSRSLAGDGLTYQFEYTDNMLCSCLEKFVKDNENLKELSKNSTVLKDRLYDAIGQDFIDKSIGVHSLDHLKKHINEESFNRVLSDVKNEFGPVRAKSSFMDPKDYTDREIMLFDFLISLVRGVVAPIVDSYSKIEKSNGEISASFIQQTINEAYKQRYTAGASIAVIALVNAYNEQPEWFQKSDLMVNLVIMPFTTALIDVCRHALKEKGFMTGPFQQELAKGGSRTIVRLCVQVFKDMMEGKPIDIRALAIITGGGAFKEFFGCVNQGLSNAEGYLQSPLGTAQQYGDKFIKEISENKDSEGAEKELNAWLALLSKQYHQAPEFIGKQTDYMNKENKGTRDVIDNIPRIDSDLFGHLTRWGNSVHANDVILDNLKISVIGVNKLMTQANIPQPNEVPNNQIRQRRHRP